MSATRAIAGLDRAPPAGNLLGERPALNEGLIPAASRLTGGRRTWKRAGRRSLRCSRLERSYPDPFPHDRRSRSIRRTSRSSSTRSRRAI